MRRMILAVQKFAREHTITDAMVDEFERALEYLGKLHSVEADGDLPEAIPDLSKPFRTILNEQAAAPDGQPQSVGVAADESTGLRPRLSMVANFRTPVIPPHPDDVLARAQEPAAPEGQIREGGL